MPPEILLNQGVGHLAGLFLGDIGTVKAHGLCLAGRDKQHVALPQKFFRPLLVQNGPGIHPGGHLESDPDGEVGLDGSGDHVHRGTLGGHHQMDAHRPGHLGQAGQRFFHLFPVRSQDDVRKFVNHDHDIGHGPFACLFGPPVVGSDVPATCPGQQVIPELHPLHRLLQGLHCGFALLDHGHEEVGNALIKGEFHPLGIHQKKPDLVRAHPEKDAGDHGVDGHGLSGTRGTGDEQVGHARKVSEHGKPRRVHPEGKGKGRRHSAELWTIHQLFEMDSPPLGGGDLNPHKPPVGQRGHHPDLTAFEPQGQVVRQLGDPGDFHPRRRGVFIAGHHRSRVEVHHLPGDAELLQHLLQLSGLLFIHLAGNFLCGDRIGKEGNQRLAFGIDQGGVHLFQAMG